MRAILAAHNSCHELWDQNRFKNTSHLESVNVSKHAILSPKTNQTDWRQPFNVFRSQISFLFCSTLKKYVYSGQLAYETCETNLHTISMLQAKIVQIKLKQWSSRSVKWRKTCEFVPAVLFWVVVLAATTQINKRRCYKTTVTRYSLSWSGWRARDPDQAFRLGILRVQGVFRNCK